MCNPDPGSDDKPRLIVVIPTILVCLGAMFLFLNSRKPPRELNDSPLITTNTNVPLVRVAPSNQIVRRSATYRLGPPLRAASPETLPYEQPTALIENAKPQTQTISPSDGNSEPALVETPVLLNSGIEISGRVTLSSPPPQEILIDMSSDPRCGALHQQAATTQHYLVAKDGGLANVFVHIRSGLTLKSFVTPTNAPLLDQVACFYQPYMMGLMVRQKFKIKNSDPTFHNVHALPRQGDNREFNFVQPAGNTLSERSFPSPEIFVRFRCDVHPWMFAYVAIMEHPFFAVTDTNGFFKLPPTLPPGRYTLEAIHLKAGSASKEIGVNAGEKRSVDFALQVPTGP